MTLSELLDALAAAGARLAVDAKSGRLRYTGPRLAPSSPVARALSTFGPELAWLVAAERLCCFCARLLAAGDRIACGRHRRALDAAP